MRPRRPHSGAFLDEATRVLILIVAEHGSRMSARTARLPPGRADRIQAPEPGPGSSASPVQEPTCVQNNACRTPLPALRHRTPSDQAYSKVLIFHMVGGSVEASGGFGWLAGDVDPSCRGVVGLVGEDAGRLVGLRTWRFARCRAPGRGLLAGRGAQPDGGVRTASRASCGRAA